MKEKGNNKASKLKSFGYFAGAISVAAWLVAMDWKGPFKLGEFSGQVFGITLFGVLFFALGLAPFIVASQEKGIFERVLTIAGALAFNGGMIWYFFFR